ncbi:MAG: hypothetical protein GXO32_00225 [Crenarchaeota archaeon]|nr:hypothetical protein [Thermoproteota archaeon]
MGSELGLLLSISLSGYGMAFAIISLIVAIPYFLLRREVAPKPTARAEQPSAAGAKEVAGASEEEAMLLAAAVAAAMHVHTSLRRRAPAARAYTGYAPVSGWIVAARIDQMTSLERGWGGRAWRTYRS